MSDAMLLIKFDDGTAFRWRIPEKYGWKLFFEKWKSAITDDKIKTEPSKSNEMFTARTNDVFGDLSWDNP